MLSKRSLWAWYFEQVGRPGLVAGSVCAAALLIGCGSSDVAGGPDAGLDIDATVIDAAAPGIDSAPEPDDDLTSMLPPWASTSFFVMGSPRPVPSSREV